MSPVCLRLICAAYNSDAEAIRKQLSETRAKIGLGERKKLNEKMYAVASEMERIAIRILSTDYQMLLFGDKIKLRGIILQILFGCSEYAYFQSADTSSLRSHRKHA